MNVSFDIAKGEYITILEPDDFIKQGIYNRLYSIYEKFDFVKSNFLDLQLMNTEN